MEPAFEYARAQMLGLTFEPFRLTQNNLRYTYDGRMAPVLRLLIGLGLASLARRLFGFVLEVS